MRIAVLLLAGLAACSRSTDENLGLGRGGRAPAVDVARLSSPDELGRALALDGAELDRRIGARAFEASSSIKIEAPGRPAETLDESYRLDSDGHGALRLTHDNSRGGGTEAVVLGGELYVRPRYGRFVRRHPDGDEVERLRATVEGVAADYLSLLERWLVIRETGPADAGGRRGLRLVLSARASPSSGPNETDPARRWRNTIEVRALDGELTLDAATGALVAARLDATYSFVREDGPAKERFVVTVSYKRAPAAPRQIAAPADALVSPARTRPMLDRQALLDGLPTVKPKTRGQP